MDKKNRPVNLDLTTIHFPPAAIASLLHRISGIILFLFIPFLLWLLEESLKSPQSYQHLYQTMASPIIKVIFLGFFTALFYHLIAGIRHLLMDLGIGETLKGGRNSALFTMGLTIILTILIGFWLW